jgi:tRNA threonylcarbamoyladenosine biosynthesis protein TsaB
MAWASEGEQVLCCLDARMREVYVAAYAREGGVLRMVMPPAVLAPARVELPAQSPGAWIGVGPGFTAYPELGVRLRLAALRPEILPTAVAIATLALPRLRAGEGLAAADALPLYVRHRVALTDVERAAGERL